MQNVSRLVVSAFLLLGACVEADVESVRERDLEGAYEALRTNIAAIHRRDTEGYLAHYLESPELVVATADSLRRGFVLFSEARRASDEWPDTLIIDRPTMVWVAPGVVWAGFRFTAVLGRDTTRGVSERLFVKTGGGWKIRVTSSMEQ